MHQKNKNIKVALSFGSNIGNAEDIFNVAIAKLVTCGFRNIKRSSMYFSKAIDCIDNTPDFTNIAITGEWDGTPESLLNLTQEIEEKSGRSKNHKSGTSRTLDIDIILFGDLISNDISLKIPHPSAILRLFVIFPLNEIASDWIFPDNGCIVFQILEDLNKSNA